MVGWEVLDMLSVVNGKSRGQPMSPSTAPRLDLPLEACASRIRAPTLVLMVRQLRRKPYTCKTKAKHLRPLRRPDKWQVAEKCDCLCQSAFGS